MTNITPPPSPERMLAGSVDESSAFFVEHLARYDFAMQFLRRGMTVLDAACGSGYGSHLLAGLGCDVIGGDISAEALDEARARYSHPRLQYRQLDCTRLDLPSRTLDVYISFETIEHFGNQDDYLREAKRVLKPDGIFICSTPNKDVHEYYRSRGWMGPNPYHVKELTVGEFRNLLESRFASVQLYSQNFDSTAMRLRALSHTVSELKWQVDHLPATILKSLVPRWVLKAIRRVDTKRSGRESGFDLDMVKISRSNLARSDVVIAVCREAGQGVRS